MRVILRFLSLIVEGQSHRTVSTKHNLSEEKGKLFADDTSMYLCLENPHIRTEIVNNVLEKIMQWENKLKI